MRIPLLVLALLALWPPPALASWRRPVPGAVARPFEYSPADPFRAGAHRGVDLSARPGARVRAACDGVVVTARAPGVGAGVVTLRCGRWRVTALPLASVSARLGAHVHAGTVVGRLGTMAGHTGLHLGVRRAGDAFAYVDPLPLLTGAPPPLPMVPRAGRPRVAPPRVSAPPLAAPRVAAPGPRVSAPPQPGGVRVLAREGAGGLAPWPAWAGLGLLALGAVGGGLRFRARGRLAEPATEGVPSAS